MAKNLEHRNKFQSEDIKARGPVPLHFVPALMDLGVLGTPQWWKAAANPDRLSHSKVTEFCSEKWMAGRSLSIKVRTDNCHSIYYDTPHMWDSIKTPTSPSTCLTSPSEISDMTAWAQTIGKGVLLLSLVAKVQPCWDTQVITWAPEQQDLCIWNTFASISAL